jgi:polyhydroxyalkanoate synthesis regulator phasin
MTGGVFMLKEATKKLILAGIGMFSLTREKAEQIIKELVEKGQVDKDEAKGLLDELITRGEKERTALRQFIRKEFEKTQSELGLVSKKELEALKTKIDNLEARLNSPS